MFGVDVIWIEMGGLAWEIVLNFMVALFRYYIRCARC